MCPIQFKSFHNYLDLHNEKRSRKSLAINHLHIPEYAKQEMYAQYWSISMPHTNSLRISGSIYSKLCACDQAYTANCVLVIKLAAELYRATFVAKTASEMPWRYASDQISHYGL